MPVGTRSDRGIDRHMVTGERFTARGAVGRALDRGRPALVVLRDGIVGRLPGGVAGRG
jgi:hypothetical protein